MTPRTKTCPSGSFASGTLFWHQRAEVSGETPGTKTNMQAVPCAPNSGGAGTNRQSRKTRVGTTGRSDDSGAHYKVGAPTFVTALSRFASRRRTRSDDRGIWLFSGFLSHRWCSTSWKSARSLTGGEALQPGKTYEPSPCPPHVVDASSRLP